MDDILLLQPDQRARAALVGVLSPLHQIRTVGSFREVEALLRTEQPLACLLDLAENRESASLDSLRRVRRHHPTVALIVASDFREREMELYHLGRLNVDGVIRLEKRISPREILAVVDQALAASLANKVVLEAATHLPGLAQEAIRWTIEHAELRPQVSELAAALAMSPRAFVREMKGLDLGPPRALLLWGRLIRASHLLERASETVESVAFRLGYSTGGALGKALKKHVGCSPSVLLQQGGLECTLHVFRLRGLRPAGSE